MKLKNTSMSGPICVKILKYQCISKNFPLLCRQFFPFITLKQTIFFSQIQLANNFFKKKVTPPPDKKLMVHPLRSNFPWPYRSKYKKTFPMWSKVRTNSTNFLSIKLRQVRMVQFFYVKYTKMSSFFLVAEALTGLVYHCPLGENSSFQFSGLKNTPTEKKCLWAQFKT